MRHQVTEGIVLKRTIFAETDRIITVLNPLQGKLHLIAKGVRKPKSRLAGGIELFSISDLTYIPGRRDLHTLISSRLKQHFGHIVTDIRRTMLGYELLKRLDKVTEDAPDSDYFQLLSAALAALDGDLSIELFELWFDAQLIRLAGHQPNLKSDIHNQHLEAGQNYLFDSDQMAFAAAAQPASSALTAAHIKLLRLLFSLPQPVQLANLQGTAAVLPACRQLILDLRRRSLGL
jgi:DNA repair protein RecO (recombination protein O)